MLLERQREATEISPIDIFELESRKRDLTGGRDELPYIASPWDQPVGSSNVGSWMLREESERRKYAWARFSAETQFRDRADR
jgi:hypothetical protein